MNQPVLVHSVCRCITLAAFFLSGVCFAQSPEIDDPVRVEAKNLMHEAADARKAGDQERARELYRESMKLYPSYDVACNLGGLNAEMGYRVEAATALEFCLRNFPSGQSSKVKKRAMEAFDAVRAKIGTVRITVNEPNVEVLIDGEPVGTSPIKHDVFVLAGEHYAEVESEKGRAGSAFRVDKGASVRVSLEIAPEETAEKPTAVPDSQPENAPANAARGAKRNWTPAWIIGGATVATLGTSMVFRGLAASSVDKKDEAQAGLSDSSCAQADAPAACSDVEKYGERANNQGTVADATLIASGVLGAATLGYVLYTLGKKPSKEGPEASLSVERGGLSFSLSGHF